MLIIDYSIFVNKSSEMRQAQQSYTQEQVLAKFSFNEQHRRYELLDPSFAKILVDLRLGSKQTSLQNSTAWIIFPQEFIYLICCLDMPNQFVMSIYSMLTSLQFDKSIFYNWMRKRSRLLRRRSQQVYNIYSSAEAYNSDKPAYSIALYQSDNPIICLLKDKIDYNKIAIIRNRDVVIFDVVP